MALLISFPTFLFTCVCELRFIAECHFCWVRGIICEISTVLLLVGALLKFEIVER